MRRLADIGVVLAATVFVAAAGYVILFAAARALGPAAYAEFAVVWAALYLGVGAVFGIQQEVTRAVAARVGIASPAGDRAVVSAIPIAAGVAAVLVVSAPAWTTSFSSGVALRVGLVALGVVLYAGQCVLVGALAGSGAWRRNSLVVVLEASVRVLVVLVVVAAAADVTWLTVASVTGMFAWVLTLLTRWGRSAIGVRLARGIWSSAARMAQATVAAAASALLVTGFPVVVASVRGGAPAPELGVVILVVTLTRAPLLVPLNALMGMVIAALQPAASRTRRLLLGGAAIAGTAVLLAAVAAVIGPPLLLLFGSAYVVSGALTAGCVVAAGALALVSLTGAGALAAGKHALFVAGWLLAAAASIVVLATPLPLSSAVVASLIAGPCLGVIPHLIAVRPSKRN